jgi:hypothetical protein
MVADRLLPALGVSLVLGLIVAALLIVRRRQLPPDFVGRVKADAYLAMLRAMLLLLAGLALLLGGFIARAGAFPATLRWLAVALIVIGGVAFEARVALYLLRTRPELDRLREPLPPAATAELGASDAIVPTESMATSAESRTSDATNPRVRPG